MSALLEEKEERFDPVLFNAAVRLIPAFPIGVQVELTDGRIAAVVKNSVKAPCKPTVIPLPATNALPKPDAKPIDLSATGNLGVAKVNGVDVRNQLYRAPAVEQDPLDYWALKDVLKKIPAEEPEPVEA